MAYCDQCGEQVPPQGKFCPICGVATGLAPVLTPPVPRTEPERGPIWRRTTFTVAERDRFFRTFVVYALIGMLQISAFGAGLVTSILALLGIVMGAFYLWRVDK